MKKSKLVELLKTFNQKEWRAFVDFTNSPYFNKKKELVDLLSYLRQLSQKDFPEVFIERRKVFETLFPQESYQVKNFNHLISELFQLAEHFLSIRSFEHNGILPNYYLLAEYVDRKQEKSYQLAWRQAKKKLEQEALRDEGFYFQQFLLSDVAEQHFQSKTLRQYDKSLDEAAAHFDIYFISKKLKYLCAMLAWEKMIAVPYEKSMLSELKSYLAQHDFSAYPSIQLYHKLLLALTEPAESGHFSAFRSLLKSSAAFFSQGEMKILYYFAINYCIDKLRHGIHHYTGDLMELYESGIEGAYLLEEGIISPWTFKNMVKLSIGLKRFDWAEQFVKNYSGKLPEGSREDAFHFNMADLYYARKNYQEAQIHLNQVGFSDIHYSLGAKELLLKIFYENKDTEAFLSLVSSFKIFLKRNKLVSRQAKIPYENFVKLAYQLHRHRNKPVEGLKEKIENTPMLTARSWLVDQWERGSEK